MIRGTGRWGARPENVQIQTLTGHGRPRQLDRGRSRPRRRHRVARISPWPHCADQSLVRICQRNRSHGSPPARTAETSRSLFLRHQLDTLSGRIRKRIGKGRNPCSVRAARSTSSSSLTGAVAAGATCSRRARSNAGQYCSSASLVRPPPVDVADLISHFTESSLDCRSMPLPPYGPTRQTESDLGCAGCSRRMNSLQILHKRQRAPRPRLRTMSSRQAVAFVRRQPASIGPLRNLSRGNP